jgi:hypothetical protein
MNDAEYWKLLFRINKQFGMAWRMAGIVNYSDIGKYANCSGAPLLPNPQGGRLTFDEGREELAPGRHIPIVIVPKRTEAAAIPYETYCSHRLRVSSVIAASAIAIWISVIACAQR